MPADDEPPHLISQNWATAWLFLYMPWIIVVPKYLRAVGQEEAAGWRSDFLIPTTVIGFIAGCFLVSAPTKRRVIFFAVLSAVHLGMAAGFYPM
ncbi:MAG TPA: hypothetical protein VF950_17935 [Planctomycetota bacterium]